MIIAYRAASLSNILYTTLVGTLDVVAKGEERITTQTYLGILGNPFLFLCQRQHLGFLSEELLPSTIAKNVIVLILRDIHIYGVIAVSSADSLLERQVQHLRMLAQPPDVGLLTSQTCTVDTALLTGTDTDSLSVLHIAHRVTLCVLQSYQGNDQVAFSLSRERLVLSGDVIKQCGVVKLNLVASLFEADAKHLLGLYRSGLIGRVYLNDVVGSL